MASFCGNGFGCACGREQCDDNCQTYRNYKQMPSYPRLNGGQCADASCPNKTSFGYCSYTACVNPKYRTYNNIVERNATTNYSRIISKPPEELAEWIAGGVLNLTGGSLKMATEAWANWLKQEATE